MILTAGHCLFKNKCNKTSFSWKKKIAGKKLVYIESFAKVTSPTKTGKLMYKIADQFYVQWKSMLTIYPGAIYLGGIY